MKKAVRWIVPAAVFLLVALAAPILFQIPAIGRLSGPENEFLEVDGTIYVRVTDSPHTANDRGRYLGAAKSGELTMRLFSVRGEPDGEYLFALWDWEGYFYRRQDPRISG